MARLLVVNPDPRIRGALARMISTAGHVADEFDSPDAALGAVDGAELVFASAGPGGSAIDPTMAVLGTAATPPKVVWTGPVAAMIQPAVAAGVGVDCLELPTRLPALNALLARHLKRVVGDRWSGEAFLRQVRGKGDRFPPIRVLFLAHRLSATGTLRVGTMEVVLQQGRIADAKGFPTIGAGGGLMHAIGMAIAQGKTPDTAMQDAGVDVIRALVRLDASPLDVSFESHTQRAPVVLPTALPRLLVLSLKAERPGAEVKRALAGRPSRAITLQTPDDSPETSWGLSPVALRVVRAAKRAQTMGALVSASGGADRDSVWEAVDFLLHLGIVCFDDTVVRTKASGATDDVVFTDIVIEAVKTRPTDPRVADFKARAAEVEGSRPWELFELDDPADVTVDVVAERFRKLSVSWHPDRFNGEPEDVTDAAAEVFAALGDARDRFHDEAFRAEVRERLIAQRKGEVFVTDTERKKARTAFKKGEHAARRKDWDTAISNLEKAVNLDPTAWEAQLQLTLARWRSGGIEPLVAARQFKAITPTNPQGRAEVLFQMGEALLAGDKEKAAHKAFRDATQAAPDHVGAARRLRMHARREQATDPPDDKKSGLRGMFGWGRRKS